MTLLEKLALAAIGFTLLTVVGLNLFFPLATQDEVTFTVTGKERIVESSGEHTSAKYLVFTEEETFQNTDCWVLWKFSSSDLQGKLREGQRYHADVYGWRVPFLSMYRNVVGVREI